MLSQDGIEVQSSKVIPDEDYEDMKSSCVSMLRSLKEKYLSSEYKSKLQVLTMAPKHWGIERVSKFFSNESILCPISQVRKAIQLRDTSGPLVYPKPRIGKTLPQDTLDRAVSFYNEEIISRAMPGMKDNLSVVVDGTKIRKVKRLLLANLRYVHKLYIEEHRNTNPVGFSKFCSLRPKEVVLANSKGVHNVCVCIYHGNVKLMLEAIRLDTSFRGSLMDTLVCENYENEVRVRRDQCMLGTCHICKRPNPEKEMKFKGLILEQLEHRNITDSVKYSQWTSAETRGGLQTVLATPEDFIATLLQQVLVLLPHHYVSSAQALEFKRVRSLNFLMPETAMIQVKAFY